MLFDHSEELYRIELNTPGLSLKEKLKRSSRPSKSGFHNYKKLMYLRRLTKKGFEGYVTKANFLSIGDIIKKENDHAIMALIK